MENCYIIPIPIKTTTNMKYIIIFILFFYAFVHAQNYKTDPEEEKKISDLLDKMTIDEKIGQLVQIVGTRESDTNYIKNGTVGSFLLGVNVSDRAELLQRTAVEKSRLGIPLLFANDVLHGYRTIFPIPLGEAASFNPLLVTKASEIAAFEAASDGTHWTYAPMVDIARDPRWGRIMEGSGEDPYLGSVMASARVIGFQGKNIKDKSKIAACPKHYVAYGGAEGGRDYNTVDISERTLREVYLPPFHSAINSGAATVMSAFNDLNGIPASANHFTLTEILKDEWNWGGVIISDYNSIGELIKHRFAKDKKEAARLGLNAGVDIDMVGDSSDGNVYAPHLKNLFQEGSVSEKTINEAVRRVLRLKYKLGLFENPYIDFKYFRQYDPGQAYKDSIALQLARESIVLLKNDGGLLPINSNVKSIAVIGPLADSKEDIIGGWSAAGDPKDAITMLEGLRNSVKDINITYSKGCDIMGTDTSGFVEAVNAAKNSDIAIIVVGEDRGMSGEAGSKVDLDLPGVQEKLIRRIYQTGVPVIVVLMNGRPLTINWTAENVPAILETWYTGTQGGNAIADVLLGMYNPSGKLPVTFPGSVGQIPIYYYQKSTGRPRKEEDRFTSKYLDFPNTPLFPFGFGLSYTEFKYKDLRTSKNVISPGDSLSVTVNVANTGKLAGEEVVQLYIQDEAASVTRPVKELKSFRKLMLQPGTSTTLSFVVKPEMLSFLDKDLKPVVEPGKFNIMIGGNSVDVVTTSFEVKQ